MKIAIGLSGGVDSAVSAALLKKQGHEVIGVFMKNWSDDFGIEGACPWEEDQRDAKAVADHLGIPFLTYNFELQYRERVIEYFFAEYKAGRTPNPDILCNSEIKFNVFLKKAREELGVDKIATGHYARIIENFNPQLLIINYQLFKGLDNSKDQSYFLCRLTEDELSKVEFPIGHLMKSEVRKIAAELKLPVANKKDSQGICFIGKINVRKFLESELGMKEGSILDIDTDVVMGNHKGLWFYTIGQREGLGFSGGPWFVVKKDIEKNIVYIAKGKNNPALFSTQVKIGEIQFLNYELLISNLDKLEVSLRYHQIPSKANLLEFNNSTIQQFPVVIPTEFNNDGNKFETLNLEFETPQRAVSPGQFACLFIGEEIVGSGIIA